MTRMTTQLVNINYRSAKKVIDTLTKISQKNNVPLDEMELELTSYYDSVTACVSFDRPMTEQELRVHEEREKNILIYKKAQLERLKKELGED